MPRRERNSAITVLVVFALVFLTLSVISFTGMSSTTDEPVHLASGYLELKAHDYRIDPLHPPFLRMWAALPLLLQHGVRLPDRQNIDKLTPLEWLFNPGLDNEFGYVLDFIYKINDADHMLYAARFMIALLGVSLGILIFCWAREWLGFWPAVVALGFYAFEPNIMAHASLVTTDFGIACFLFGSVYFLWRTTRCLSLMNLAALAVFSGLAAASKFSAVALGPILLVLLAIRALRTTPWPCKIGKLKEIRTRWGFAAAGAGILLLVGFACWGAIWTVCGFRYLPSSTTGWRYIVDVDASEGPHSIARMIARVVHAVDKRHLLPNAYSQGFLLQELNTHGHPAFLAGKISPNGWWYYFPVAFLIKTPVSLILLFLGGVILCAVRWKEFWANTSFVLVPMCLYMAVAMSSALNIGVRHILPIYPFAILLAALCAFELMRAKRRVFVGLLGVLCLFWLFEFARVYPHNLAFFNSFIGGPKNGYKYLADSNIDWGQDLKGLKSWMDKQGVQHINLDYFGFGVPAYYGIQSTDIAGGTESFVPPQLPGYVAVSVTFLDGPTRPPAAKTFYEPLASRKPDAVIGYSIHVYWVERRWW